MSQQTFSRSVRIARPAAEVYGWHLRPGALQRLTPPWEQVEVLRHEGIFDGARAELRVKAGPIWTHWSVRHEAVIADKQFCDRQLQGPFSSWEHLHAIEPDGAAACVLTDTIRYVLPGGLAGRLLGGRLMQRQLERLFRYRHAVTRADVELQGRHGRVRRLKFLIAGASGLVGRALVPFLRSQGHEVLRLVRNQTADTDVVFWQPAAGQLDPAALRGVDVIVNLAGENVADGRWTAERRRALQESRVQATRTLVNAASRLRHAPFLFLSASAIGFYGERGEEAVTEESAGGSGFLAELCADWEKETARAEEFGMRAAALRIGLVLTPAGGALARLLPFFRAGLGGRLGNGRQWVSWITLDDLLGVIYHTVLDQRCSGPVNAVSPQPVRQEELARRLGRMLKRPALLPLPVMGLRLAFGRMAEETLLASTQVRPGILQEAGYEFRQPCLHDALRHLLGRG